MNLDPVEILPDTPQMKIKTPAERLQEGSLPPTPAKTGKHKAIKGGFFGKNSPLRAGQKSFRWKIIAALLAVGFGFGGYFVGGKLARSSPTPMRIEEEPPPPVTLRSLDELMIDGDWPTALKLARFRYKTGPTNDRPALRYREALSLEFSGDLHAASEIFAKLTEADSPVAGAARLGLARCRLAENRLEEARTLLAGLVLLNESQNIKAYNLGAEAAYSQVRLALMDLQLAPEPSPWEALGLAKAHRHQDISRFLAWVPLKAAKKPLHTEEIHHVLHLDEMNAPPAEENAPKQEPPHPMPEAVPQQKNDAPPPSWQIKPHASVAYRSLVTAKASSLSVQEVLGWVARDLQIPISIDPKVTEKISGKQYPVDVKQITVGDFLGLMLEPLGCRLTWTDRSCSIQPESDDPEDTYTNVKKLIQRALVIGPDHPERNVCLVELGNLEVSLKNYREAMTTYNRVLREASLTPEALPAAYNLGLMQLRLGDRKTARETFQNVADRDLHGKWVPLAHYWAGRAAFENNDLDQARLSFQRAMKANPESESAAAAALGLSYIEMLMDSPSQARMILRPYKKALGQGPTRQAVALVDAYARFKLAKRPNATGEMDDLIHAVLTGGDSSPLGPAGLLLMGQAARDAGLDIKLTQLYDQAAEQLNGPLGIRFLAEAGEQYYNQGEWDAARSRYRAVAAVDQGNYGIQARLRLVDLCLKKSLKEEALRYALEALILPGVDREAGLKALGRCYEALGDHTRAVACYSGQVPD